ncbi:ankyrin repeat domain-containing protein 34B-like [Crassostrea angulata]|uniref:ankyrin repeat domain-containing protein 34B-like n=1 Tax=Magallana angulata TaxID=2784310 RepID=UPI0022B11799|nr:ankyrin repeat domain-containing protein 34B-like [Crassostrea angulata]
MSSCNIMKAVSDGKFRLGRILAEGGANVHERNQEQMTVLMAACGIETNECHRHQKLKLIQTLLENGANPQDLDRSGKSCLEYTRSQSIDVRNTVIQYLAKTDQNSSTG